MVGKDGIKEGKLKRHVALIYSKVFKVVPFKRGLRIWFYAEEKD